MYGRVSEFDLGYNFGAAPVSDYALGVYVIKLFGSVGNINGADVLSSFKAYLGKDADIIIGSIGAAAHKLDMGVMQQKIDAWIRSGKTPMALTLPDVRSVMLSAAEHTSGAAKTAVGVIFENLSSISKTGVEAGKAITASTTGIVKGIGDVAKYMPLILLGAGLLIAWKLYLDSRKNV